MAGGYIYLLIDGTNDFEYVGQTTRSVEVRFKEHLREKTCIGDAMRAHGAYMFVVAILKKCDTNEELDRWEKHFILSCGTKRPNGYNCTDGGDGTSGHLQSVETRAKIRAANKGKKVSAATCAKISEANTGKKRSDEERKKMSKVRKGRKPSTETCARISASLTGKKFTEERCLNISLAKRGTTPYKNLLAEIDKRRLSYKELAKILGWLPGNFYRKMRGEIRFTARDKAKLAEIFGKPAEYLFAT